MSEYPLAAKVPEQLFHVDDVLTGADDIQTAIAIQRELQCLFERVVSNCTNGGSLLEEVKRN